MPLYTEAGLFSSLLGTPASAQGDLVEPVLNTNSQNMALLQANVSSAQILEKKAQETKTSKDTKTIKTKAVEVALSDSTDNIDSENALLPATSPLGVSDGTEVVDSSEQASVYVVRKGDSISQIADMFDVSVNTILLANDLKKNSKLTEGDVLIILPVSGIEYVVKKGDTLKSIAKDHKADVGDIAVYNGLATDAKLAVGDKITIPGADDMSDEGGDKPAPNLGTSVATDKNYYVTHPLQNLLGYFINPVPAGHKTQGLHGPGHRGIDIGAPTGTEIYGSADGVVIATKSGCRVGQRRCGGGYGNMAIVEHSNGTKTLYGHMSKLLVSTGTQISRGQVIGLVGSTGKSTGPHLHFEVFGAKNPGSDWSWAN